MEQLTQSNFLKLLFGQGEYTTFTAFAKGFLSTRVSPAHSEPSFDSQYFCINPLDGEKDSDPNQPWHSPVIPRRADANVTAYRNFLIESDTTPIDQQLELFQKTSCPVSAIVFSGGKSFHFFISLSTPLADEKEYRLTHQLICAALKNASCGAFRADTSTKNPSRLGRLGNAIRNNGNLQKIEFLGERVDPQALKNWVEEHAEEEITALKKQSAHSKKAQDQRQLLQRYSQHFNINLGEYQSVPNYVQEYLKNGAVVGERNSTLFKVAAFFAEQGFDETEIMNKVALICDLPDREIRNTIKSAVNRVNK